VEDCIDTRKSVPEGRGKKERVTPGKKKKEKKKIVSGKKMPHARAADGCFLYGCLDHRRKNEEEGGGKA